MRRQVMSNALWQDACISVGSWNPRNLFQQEKSKNFTKWICFNMVQTKTRKGKRIKRLCNYWPLISVVLTIITKFVTQSYNQKQMEIWCMEFWETCTSGKKMCKVLPSLGKLNNDSASHQINILCDTYIMVLAVLTAISPWHIPSAVILAVISFSFISNPSKLSSFSPRSWSKNFLCMGLSPMLRVLKASVLKNPIFASAPITPLKPACYVNALNLYINKPINFQKRTQWEPNKDPLCP